MTTDDPLLPWYKDGLRFQCTECGKCCTGKGGFVWVTPEEMAAMAKLVGMPPEVFKRRYIRVREYRLALVEKKSGDCIFLEGKKCQIYQARPKQCRTYPWWKENLNSPESWQVAATACEGINDNAPLIPLSEIVQNYSEK